VNDSLKQQLNSSSRTSMDPVMVDDLQWRAKHLGLETDFWSDVRADIPYQLTEVNAIEYPSGPLDGPCPLSSPILQQTLWENPFYKNAQLVRNPFRCFHRSDGVLLTMSPDLGVDYLDKDLGEYLKYPRDRRIESEEASVLGFMWKRFRISGTHTWHKPTVEWFLVYLLTELAATPHTIRQGRNSMSLISAYQQVVQDLKLRRYDIFERHKSVGLVRQYLTCIDELTSVCGILQRKIDTLNKLMELVELDGPGEDLVDLEPADPRDQPETASGRIKWATDIVQDQHRCCQSLLEDLRLAAEALFQLRSIEQNELAIVADSQNKAILIFTIVTIIFLPLSFFTGYFGMNLKGVGLNKDESWFWEVCGTVAFLIIVGSMVYAFRYRLRQAIFRPRFSVV